MYCLVNTDKRKAHYKTYYEQDKERHTHRYTEQKLKLKEDELSVETNEHNKPLSVMNKFYSLNYLFVLFDFL